MALLQNLHHYSGVILTACALFPLVAAAFTLPFAVRQYRRYGGIPVIRVVAVYSFILYCMCALALTVLPLPSREAVAAMRPRPIGWIPFGELIGKMKAVGLSLSDPSTLKDPALWRRVLHSFELFQVLANLALLAPLGFYCRSYFRLSWRKTLLAGFLTSLFFELAQLTGLFFYYPHAYRYAETGDLISNSLGALLGYGLAVLAAPLLPSRETIDELSYRKGRRVTRIRRLLSALLDLLTGAALAAAAAIALRYVRAWVLAPVLLLCLALIPYALGGSTAGQALVKLRTVRQDGQRAGFWQLLWRNALFALELFVPPACLGQLIACAASALSARALPPRPVLLAAAACAAACAGIFTLSFITLRRRGTLPHSCLSRTTVISYNIIPQEEPSP